MINISVFSELGYVYNVRKKKMFQVENAVTEVEPQKSSVPGA